MTMAQIEALPGRLAHEMLVAYGERKRFEAQIIAAAVWGRGETEQGDIEGGSDEDLSPVMAIS